MKAARRIRSWKNFNNVFRRRVGQCYRDRREISWNLNRARGCRRNGENQGNHENKETRGLGTLCKRHPHFLSRFPAHLYRPLIFPHDFASTLDGSQAKSYGPIQISAASIPNILGY